MTDYLTKFFNLQGKVAILTGGGGYLVGTMCQGLAQAGVKVAVVDLRLEKAQAVAKQIEDEGGQAIGLAADVRSKDETEATLKATLDRFGQLDYAVVGAGINAPTPFLDIKAEEWQQVLDVQLLGTVLSCQVYGAHMLAQGKGSIITISSASAGPPLSKAFAYSAAKAGIMNLTQNIAREWAKQGVRVNALRPGFFPTEWNRKNFITKEREAAILGHTPMGRFGETEELLGAVYWLLSDAASFVTGAEIHVDGGFSAMTI